MLKAYTWAGYAQPALQGGGNMSHCACVVNDGKQLVVWQDDKKYFCYAVKTKVIDEHDTIEQITEEYILPIVTEQDIVFVSEKMIACMQGRAIPMNKIKPGLCARFLCRFVNKTPAGDGLGMPETMQCAIDECGLPTILLASAAGCVGKLVGKKGWFYQVAGSSAASIDSPCEWTIPPYDQTVILEPKNPAGVAKEISYRLGGNLVLVVDLNDLGGNILGCSHSMANTKELLSLLRQNPLGQSNQSTPIGILRPAG